MGIIHTHSTTRAVLGEKWTWLVSDLWEAAKDLPVSEVIPETIPEYRHLMAQSVGAIWWNREQGERGVFTMEDMVRHSAQVMNADLSCPILLNPKGGVMDGIHRVVKAVILGKNVKVQLFKRWPEPWKKEKVISPTNCPERDKQCDPQCAVWSTGDHRCQTKWLENE